MMRTVNIFACALGLLLMERSASEFDGPGITVPPASLIIYDEHVALSVPQLPPPQSRVNSGPCLMPCPMAQGF